MCAVEFAPWINEFSRVQQLAALVTLVAPRVLVLAARAFALHETVSEEGLVLLAVQLGHGLLFQVAVLIKSKEDVLRDFRLLLRGRAAKQIKAQLKPFVHFIMNSVILVAQLLA